MDGNGKIITPQERDWDSQFKKWKAEGGKKPGPHPDPDHVWNTKPEIFDIYC